MKDDPLATAEELELRTRGRRSGRTHAVRLSFAHENGVLWLRTDERAPDWLRNLRAHPMCVVRIGNSELVARYEPVDDRDSALRHLVALWRAKYGPDWVQDWYVEKGREAVKLRIEGAAGPEGDNAVTGGASDEHVSGARHPQHEHVSGEAGPDLRRRHQR